MVRVYKRKMEYMVGEPEVFPVDMNGRRVFPNKNDPNNLENVAQDIKDYYGLDERGL